MICRGFARCTVTALAEAHTVINRPKTKRERTVLFQSAYRMRAPLLRLSDDLRHEANGPSVARGLGGIGRAGTVSAGRRMLVPAVDHVRSGSPGPKLQELHDLSHQRHSWATALIAAPAAFQAVTVPVFDLRRDRWNHGGARPHPPPHLPVEVHRRSA